MKRWIPHIGIVLGICVAVYALFFSSSEEDRIRDRLDDLENTIAVTSANENIVLRAARVQKTFKQIFVKSVIIRIPELTQVESGRGQLSKLAAAAGRSYSEAHVDLSDLKIDLDAKEESAVAFGAATLTGTTRGGALQRDRRTVSLRFDKIDGDWTIVSVSVSDRDDDSPDF